MTIQFPPKATIVALCVIGAVTLLALGIDHGWGWLIVLAFCAFFV